MKAHVGVFNKEKVLVGAFSLIVKTSRRFVASSWSAPGLPSSPVWPPRSWVSSRRALSPRAWGRGTPCQAAWPPSSRTPWRSYTQPGHIIIVKCFGVSVYELWMKYHNYNSHLAEPHALATTGAARTPRVHNEAEIVRLKLCCWSILTSNSYFGVSESIVTTTIVKWWKNIHFSTLK